MEPEPWESKFARIRARYLEYGEQCTGELERSIDALERDAATADALKSLYVQFHKMAGSAGSYGFKRTSQRGLEAEVSCRALMESASPPGAAEIEHWRNCVADMRREFAEAREQSATDAPRPNEQ